MGGAISLALASQGGRVAWLVPTYKNGRPLWRWAEAAAAMARKSGKVKINRSERVIQFQCGGFLGIYSADNEDSMRGESFHLAVIDEAARIAPHVWTDVVQPTLADVDGDAILISTPRGRNWFWQEWMRGQEDGRTVASWQAPTRHNPNPNIQRAAELARDRVPDLTYRQEWLAEFVDEAGGVFRNLAACLTAPMGTTPADHPGHEFVAGVDWAQMRDFTCFSVVCTTCMAEVELDRFNLVEWEVQRGRLKAMYERWRPYSIIAEANSIGSPNIEALVNDDIPVSGFQTTATTKPQIIKSLALALERVEVRWLPVQFARDELEAYEATINPQTGRASYSAPTGGHDDSVIARALALRAATSWGSLA